MMATLWPLSSRMWASVDPTRPHPMITMCTVVPSGAVRSAWLRLDPWKTYTWPGAGQNSPDPSDALLLYFPHAAVSSHGRVATRLTVVSKAPDLVKRLLLGRALRSAQQHEQTLPKTVALPVFASDALS